MPQEKKKTHNLTAVPSTSSSDTSSDVTHDTDECPLCLGTGMEVVANKGARICSCRKASRQARKDADSTFPKRYVDCTFENYHVTSNTSQSEARTLAFILASQYPAVKQGLLFMGSVGVGKTHLAVSIAKLLKDRGFSCLFYEFGALLRDIRDSYNPNTQSSELSVLEPVLRTEVLVLDELGASKPTDWVRETLYHIINTRYNENRVTVFTTNFLDERPDPRRETLEDRIGVSIRSRLYQMCRTVVIRGDDYRETFDQPLSGKAK